jgi:hypothetical protein
LGKESLLEFKQLMNTFSRNCTQLESFELSVDLINTQNTGIQILSAFEAFNGLIDLKIWSKKVPKMQEESLSYPNCKELKSFSTNIPINLSNIDQYLSNLTSINLQTDFIYTNSHLHSLANLIKLHSIKLSTDTMFSLVTDNGVYRLIDSCRNLNDIEFSFLPVINSHTLSALKLRAETFPFTDVKFICGNNKYGTKKVYSNLYVDHYTSLIYQDFIRMGMDNIRMVMDNITVKTVLMKCIRMVIDNLAMDNILMDNIRMAMDNILMDNIRMAMDNIRMARDDILMDNIRMARDDILMDNIRMAMNNTRMARDNILMDNIRMARNNILMDNIPIAMNNIRMAMDDIPMAMDNIRMARDNILMDNIHMAMDNIRMAMDNMAMNNIRMARDNILMDNIPMAMDNFRMAMDNILLDNIRMDNIRMAMDNICMVKVNIRMAMDNICMVKVNIRMAMDNILFLFHTANTGNWKYALEYLKELLTPLKRYQCV